MKYLLRFWDADSIGGQLEDILYQDGEVPLIPRIGELVEQSYNNTGYRLVKNVSYDFETSLAQTTVITVTTGDPK